MLDTATETREWFSAAELEALALPSMPGTRRGIALAAETQGWQTRPRRGRGGGVEYHVGSLPMAARAKLALDARPAPTETPREAAKTALSHEEAWKWFEGLPEKRQVEARERLAMLDAIAALVGHGTPKVLAMQMIAAERGVTVASLYNWETMVRGVPGEHRLPRLAPRHAGREGMRADCDKMALAWLRSFWLSPSRPTVEMALRKLRLVAPSHGWTLPSDRTLRRHIDQIDKQVVVYEREGPDAADRMFPMLRRDRSALHALEMVNADGHRFDVMVRWPDDTKARPMATVFQDIYSGRILSWRVETTENTDTFRLAFGDMVEKYGIPDHVFVDNTLAAANKTMSGGVKRRFRFKVRDEEPLGILPSLDVKVHFTRPYSGQSKPIERAFGDFARDIARLPEFEGAYLGNSVANKPHNHGEKAVPLTTFLAVLEREIASHNARQGRQGGVCRGRSFDDVWAESYASVPIRKANATQRRMFLLAAESVKVRQDATIHLLGNRYHDPQMVNLIGANLVVRFDPDHLHAPVHLYRLDGGYICAAGCWADTGFADTEAARRIGQAKTLRRRGVKAIAQAEKTFDAERLARDLRAAAPEPEAPPEARVVRPIFATRGNAALAPTHQSETADLVARKEAADRRVMEALKASQAGRTTTLRVVGDDDD
jgi:putative transposase